jgi:hypothetical protein
MYWTNREYQVEADINVPLIIPVDGAIERSYVGKTAEAAKLLREVPL